ncbi:MAG TPA: PQQ-binding-like beta-propeller repeat protein [Steroidobacteraceae bacterium]|nr:PQQ-binding-like beta-propeller repeat protein [Steroidobacteraceae bacterium]
MKSIGALAALLALLPCCALAGPPAVAHFSKLARITPDNVARLGVAWVFDSGLKDNGFEDTPLVVGGTMYVLLPSEEVVALDPDSGRRLWSYDPREKWTGVSRGLGWWPGTRAIAPRLIVPTDGGRLIELDPRSGRPVPQFADRGVLDLKAIETAGYPDGPFEFTSPPAVFENLIILAPNLQEGPSRGPPGLVTAVDAVTGKIMWRFHTTPQPGEPNPGTWGRGGWQHRSGPAAWGEISVDPKLGLVFVPVANPADSYYGGDRPGRNLYANSVVALDARTGKLRWYYQLVHHDLWDTDTVSVEGVDAWTNGHEVPAVAALTKSALLFVLDRRTGKPIFGVRERPVPRSDVPGEHPWPTEPFPATPPLARQSVTAADVSTVTRESEAFCRRQFAEYRSEGAYTPFDLEPSVHFPSTDGGANWGGASYDPELGLLFINTSNLGSVGRMMKVRSRQPTLRRYRNAEIGARFIDRSGFPCQEPPWGLLSAIDLRTGRIAWQVPLGDYPELARRGAPPTGTPNVGGSLATASGLVFIGSTLDGDFRAFDARTGRMLWEAGLEGYGEATPVTYLGRSGRQYVVIAVGGPGHLRGLHESVPDPEDRLVAFSLGGVASPPTRARAN